ncbi:iron ABC transporter permease [Acuticoccus sp. M5D2P5]|uniref:ABC transporter permease n=1 Tax=Acuticoccus kalidii TaxID=2910977 RepID=UPI001F1FB24E|nr:iron ABC transporter permease [Acuticoccus kalidii]MCF3936143.1 iron ABC transporter permease [Acuticoccus kalidii]
MISKALRRRVIPSGVAFPAFQSQSLIRVATILILSVLVLYPLFWMLVGSFQPTPMRMEFSLRAYERVFTSRYLPEVLWNTGVMTVATTFFATLLGVPLAWIVARTDTPFKLLINLVAMIPFITPPMLGAIAWAYLGSPNSGFINVAWSGLTGAEEALFNVYSMTGLIVVMTLYLTPYVFLFTSIAMQNMDPTLENAAAITGAGPLRTTFTITVPLAMPAILSGAILVFIQSLEIFAIPAAIGSPGGIYVFVTQIYQLLLGVPPRFSDAAALSLPLLLICALALWLQLKIIGKDKSYTTVSGKTFRPKLITLGKWRYAALAYAGLYLILAAVLPYLVFIYGSVIRSSGLPITLDNLTLDYVIRFFTGEANPLIWRSIRNSLVLSLGGATIAVILAALCSYYSSRGKGRSKAYLDFISLVPIAIPGAVIAIGLLWAYIRPPFQLYGTLWILLIAYTTRYIPFGVKAVSSSIIQISPDLEKAAHICGAGWIRGFVTVLVPLLLPGLFAGWVLMFVSMMRELSASIMLYSSGRETMAVALYLLWDEASFQYVSLMALTLVAISLICIGLMRLVVKAGNPAGVH